MDVCLCGFPCVSVHFEPLILGAIGGRVAFTYPAGEAPAAGILTDRYVGREGPRGIVPYWDVVDRIDLGSEGEQIRIGYYRAPVIRGTQRLVWGSQTTIVESPATWKALLLGAAREKPWFWDVMRAVAAELPAERPGETQR